MVTYSPSARNARWCREGQLNLAYRWFCGLGIEDDIPDHSAFSRARNARFRDSDIFRHVFEQVVGTCIAAGLVGGEGFAVDASLIEADANKHRSIPGAEWNKDIDPAQAHRAVKEYGNARRSGLGRQQAASRRSSSHHPIPAAQWTSALRNAAFFAYADRYLIDVKFGIIMDVEVLPGHSAGRGWRITDDDRADRSQLWHQARMAAAGYRYGSAANLDWLVYQQGSHRMSRSSTSRGARRRDIQSGRASRSTRSVTFTSARRARV